MESINSEFLVIINENRGSLASITIGLSFVILFMTIIKIITNGLLSSSALKLSKVLLALGITLGAIFATTILYSYALDDKLDAIKFITVLSSQMAVVMMNNFIADKLTEVPSYDSKHSSDKNLLKRKRIKL